MLKFSICEVKDFGFWFDLSDDEHDVLLVSDLHPCIAYCISDVSSLIQRLVYGLLPDSLPDEHESDFTVRDESGRVLARSIWPMEKAERREFIRELQKNVAEAKIEILNQVN